MTSSDELTPNTEHERRFLVEDTAILKDADYQQIEQAYLWSAGGYAARVRVTRPSNGSEGDFKATFTLKGPRSPKGQRFELEVPLDADHAQQIVNLAENVVSKKRYSIFSENDLWDIDVFEGANNGLVLAEYEASEGAVARVKKPWWAGAEISARPEYNNENLAVSPRNG